ncbi:MAG: type I DNA topoisomerase [Christensenellales bacterium]|jgi:DNA topoisomerase-1
MASRKLVIVESPAKAKTIAKFLGSGYKVEASKGHVRDLPKSQLGVDIENNFEPKYITIRGRGDIINRLKKEAKGASRVYLATDPDREGEAISWHLAHLLKLNPEDKCRIAFNEITKDAVKGAIRSPRQIDLNLVDAQQARRLLDRLVGYQISPLLWRKVRKGLSAGRVQSVATRMVCDREEEIDHFVPREYWSIVAELKADGVPLEVEAQFVGLEDKNDKLPLHSRQDVDNVLRALKGQKYTLKKLETTKKSVRPAAPFTTSSLQQEASRKFGFSTKRTMVLAQQLYEGIEVEGHGLVGLVTYIRTDSVRIAREVQAAAKEMILEKYGEAYAPEEFNVFKGRNGSQDAHEAIRPTTLELSPQEVKASLSRDQHKLYTLIYNRFLASQMTPAVYQSHTAHIAAAGYRFRCSATSLLFPGHRIVYTQTEENGSEDTAEKLDERLQEGMVFSEKSINTQQHFTEPPARYNEATLVRALEEKGIGRPSTYAPIISTILDKGYVERMSGKGKPLAPTELGTIVTQLMKEYFSDVVDIEFTADLEEKLDGVETGDADWRRVLEDFYGPFEKTLKHADESIEKITIEDEVSDIPCEKCGALMVIKNGPYGKFYACPNYPECKNIKPILQSIEAPCPKCGNKILVRHSRRGRVFYGCEKYPDCDFVSWKMPVKDPCPECGGMMVRKRTTKRGQENECTNAECGHIITVELSEEEEG